MEKRNPKSEISEIHICPHLGSLPPAGHRGDRGGGEGEEEEDLQAPPQSQHHHGALHPQQVQRLQLDQGSANDFKPGVSFSSVCLLSRRLESRQLVSQFTGRSTLR